MTGAPIPNHDELLDLVAVYALGALGPDEARIVSAHIATCEECRAEYAALRPAANAIGLAANDSGPDEITSARMKRRLLTAIVPAAPKRGPVRVLAATTILALAAAVVLAFINLDSSHRLAETTAQLEADKTTVAALQASGAQSYSVPQGEILKTHGHIYLVMRTLAALPKDRVYQAWTLAPGAKSVAPSVTFKPDAHGFVVVPLPEPASGVAAVAISVEPPGGSKAPTTKPTFVRPLG